jgi:P4 family phage/plasmid primase-like protien
MHKGSIPLVSTNIKNYSRRDKIVFMVKRICERCAAPIPDEWDNDAHYGTCPECKRGSNFVPENKELQKIEDDEKKNIFKSRLLHEYGVIDKNPRTGVIHVNCINMAKLIYKECEMFFKTIEDKSTGKQEIYYYKDGMYLRGGDNRIRETVDDYLDTDSSIHRKNEVVDYIKHRNIVEREDLEPPLRYINVKNGIYDLETDKLLPHSPKYFFLNQIPVEYNPEADCPQIKKFFKDVLYTEYFDVMQEIFGYCLYRRYKYHKAFLFYGGGRNGKSTTLSLLGDFIGRDNYSTRNLHSIIDNRFALADLYGQLANIGGEISGNTLNDTTQFKHITGDDVVTAEPKYRSSFNFRNYAKLIFNSNHIPYSRFDKSKAFFDRWIILVFPETFDLDDSRTDPNISEKITTKEELEGLLIWSIQGLKRLLKTDRFSYLEDEDESEIGERYELLAKPEKRFIVDYIMLSPGNNLVTDEVYEEYESWCEKRRYPVLTKSSFSRGMKRYMQDKEKKINCDINTSSINGKTTRVYTNVVWKESPTNGVLQSLEGFGSLDERMQKLKCFVVDNVDAGYCVDDKMLKDAGFSDTIVHNSYQSGLLCKNPKGGYMWND